jgi:hypothetical protein
MIVIFGVFTITLFFIHYPAGTFAVGGFKASPFPGQFGVVAGYQISWAIYVSDYSRYMPPGLPVRKTFGRDPVLPVLPVGGRGGRDTGGRGRGGGPRGSRETGRTAHLTPARGQRLEFWRLAAL